LYTRHGTHTRGSQQPDKVPIRYDYDVLLSELIRSLTPGIEFTLLPPPSSEGASILSISILRRLGGGGAASSIGFSERAGGEADNDRCEDAADEDVGDVGTGRFSCSSFRFREVGEEMDGERECRRGEVEDVDVDGVGGVEPEAVGKR